MKNMAVTKVPYMKVCVLSFIYAVPHPNVSGLVGISWNSPMPTVNELPEVVDLAVVEFSQYPELLSPEEARTASKEREKLEKLCEKVNGLKLKYEYEPEANGEANRTGWFCDLMMIDPFKPKAVLKWLLG